VSTTIGAQAPQNHSADQPYRVMVVDDSTVIRGFIVRMLEADPRFTVVASVGDGAQAIRALTQHGAEVVVLDIEMPVMDGLTALPKLIEADPAVQVVMASTLTRKNAEISLRALTAGAADYIPKPTSAREVNADVHFKRELVEKLASLGQARRRMAPERAPRNRDARERQPRPVVPPAAPVPIVLRSAPKRVPTAIAIGSSTGGPQALVKLLSNLPKLSQPILITQHMPATFTGIMAEHIQRVAKMPCSEGKEGEVIQGSRIYLAPGDYHMRVVARGADKVIALDQGPRESFCRPAVDPMLRSMVDAYGDGVFIVMLTGMGSDGLKGSETVIKAGGALIAQDEASSVVWGMPGAVARAGLCSAILPLDQIAAYVTKCAGSAAR
jgi:two-component system, chemotaxis family, protein-glutamate methylesterase/glutaminase